MRMAPVFLQSCLLKKLELVNAEMTASAAGSCRPLRFHDLFLAVFVKPGPGKNYATERGK